MALTGRRRDGSRFELDEHNLLFHPCPTCLAKAGSDCITDSGRRTRPHKARYIAAGREKRPRQQRTPKRKYVRLQGVDFSTYRRPMP